ncbi:MAG TPA: PDZ domain-containing protein, partial [Planctomycetota bacterium]|nr:PDZ domain-containing protein [Planctomycetota bacterium]
KPFIAAWKGWLSDRDEGLPAYAGVELEEVGGVEVRVLRVYEGGPAAASGLTSGDRITKVGDRAVESFVVVKEALKRARPGETLILETLREGSARKVELTFWGKY